MKLTRHSLFVPIALALAFGPMGCGSSSGSSSDQALSGGDQGDLLAEQESNDIIPTANELGDMMMETTCTVTGDINQMGGPDNFDIFHLEAMEECVVSLELEPEQDADLVLWVAGPGGNIFANIDHAGAGETEYGTFTPMMHEPEFLLVVLSFNGASDYSLRVNGAAPAMSMGSGGGDVFAEGMDWTELALALQARKRAAADGDDGSVVVSQERAIIVEGDEVSHVDVTIEIER